MFAAQLTFVWTFLRFSPCRLCLFRLRMELKMPVFPVLHEVFVQLFLASESPSRRLNCHPGHNTCGYRWVAVETLTFGNPEPAPTRRQVRAVQELYRLPVHQVTRSQRSTALCSREWRDQRLVFIRININSQVPTVALLLFLLGICLGLDVLLRDVHILGGFLFIGDLLYS